MPITEFNIIRHHFAQAFPQRLEVSLGIGDDAAVCQVPAGMSLVTAIDTLVAGVHFPIGTTAYDIGYKALAVNLSDIAAMGATPAWITLALTTPTQDEAWFAQFAQGLRHLAQQANVSLIGGDTTYGETLTVTVQISGFVPTGQALLRSGAQVGDTIFVTGFLGDAGLGLASVQKTVNLCAATRRYVEARLARPMPRWDTGEQIRRGIANSAIDISDGLLADLSHLLTASRVGACLQLDALPLSEPLRQAVSQPAAWQLALSAGDDYELCFTVPPARHGLLAAALQGQVPYTAIGKIEAEAGIRCQDARGDLFEPDKMGYEHVF